MIVIQKISDLWLYISKIFYPKEKSLPIPIGNLYQLKTKLYYSSYNIKSVLWFVKIRITKIISDTGQCE